MSELVSVVFPVGPGAEGALAALGDILGQSWEELEVLVVLNGCPEEVRGEFGKVGDGRVRIFDLGDEGDLLGALGLAIRNARGKWLARMDSDDRCDGERIEKTMGPLLAGEGEVASCGIELEGALGDGMQRYVDWVESLGTPEEVARERFVESPVVQPTVVMAKETLLKAGGYLDNGLAEDYDLWLRLLGQGRRFVKVKEKLYRWRDHAGRLTRTHQRYGQREMLRVKARGLAGLPGVKERGVAICGAGPMGKVLASELLELGVTVHGFFEVSEKRIGGEARGRPVVSDVELGERWSEAVLLSAVGGGREAVREIAMERGFEEGVDFWCCC
ncbi:MAG: glycosyltransferase [Verrucomicrobiaceae bacterium]